MGRGLEKVKNIGSFAVWGGFITSFLLTSMVASIPIWVYNYITKNHRFVKNPDKIRLPREVKNTAKKLNKDGQIEVRFEPLRKEAWDFGAYRAYNIDYSKDGKTVNLARTMVSGENEDEFLFPAYGWHYDISALFPTTETPFLKVPKSVSIGYDISLERQMFSSFAAKFGVNTKLLQSEDLAHRAALSIATQIADYSHLPLIDYSREDRANLEKKFREVSN